MYIAMNRFKIVPGQEDAFETVWRERDTHLEDVPGYREFQLVRGPGHDDHTLYASHTLWDSKEDFVAWTKSEAFRAAHKNAGDNSALYLGHPQFEGFTVVLDSNVS
ncbi:MAG: antibiotic biosynthesis monooxygenase [Pseudomonadota bacterium]